jgi:hypothetical protein
VAREIRQAIERLEERQRSAGSGSGVVDGEEPIEQIDDYVRRVFSGLDIDVEELQSEMAGVVSIIDAALTMGLAPSTAEVGGAKFADGLAVGLLIAEARQKAEASA